MPSSHATPCPTDSRRAAWGRIGAYTALAQNDVMAMTAPGRQAAWQRFLDQVDPDGVLSEGERVRRATAARQAHLTRIALRSAATRRRRRKIV